MAQISLRFYMLLPEWAAGNTPLRIGRDPRAGFKICAVIFRLV